MPLFALATFLSAALMFLAEPLVARLVLPAAGGSPMVWNTCMVFFQAALVAGYWYARTLTAAPGRARLAVHLLVLAAPLAFLPIAIHGAPPRGANPVFWLLAVLTIAVGPAFFVLSTTTSVLQRWFADTRSRGADQPHRLYAYSNLGSVLALVAYPILVEPRLALHEQARWWTAGYAIFAVLAAAATAVAWRHQANPPATPALELAESAAAARASWRSRGRWTLLAFVPSSLMLGVTTYLATDVASVPLLWVIPLALYLGTLVVAFSAWGDDARAIAAGALPVVVLPLAVLFVTGLTVPLPLAFALHVGVFTAAALNCHGELAAARPEPAQLPDFYFWMAIGGVAGGLLNALVAPLVFSSVAEYPLVLVLACALYRPERERKRSERRIGSMDLAVVGAITGATAIFCIAAARIGLDVRIYLAGVIAAAFAVFTQSRRPIRFAVCLAGVMAAGAFASELRGTDLHRERTFFGVYRVETDSTGAFHALFHGTTLHGLQSLDPARRLEPLTYYTRGGPIGVALAGFPHFGPTASIAAVGLGSGTMAAYATGDQRWTFYEIDPAIERIARTPAYFTYLEACGRRCSVVIGDARQSLAYAGSALYDVIILDAFSSDAIPLHLLSREALRLYLAHLAPGGMLAFHISNRHLALAPVIARLAGSEQLAARDWLDGDSEPAKGKNPSEWVMMARQEADLGAIVHDARWSRPVPRPGTPLWTDEFTNIWSVLNGK